MHAVAWTITSLDPATEKRIRELVRKQRTDHERRRVRSRIGCHVGVDLAAILRIG